MKSKTGWDKKWLISISNLFCPCEGNAAAARSQTLRICQRLGAARNMFFCHLRDLFPSVSCEVLWFGFSKIRIQKQALYSPNPSPSKKCQAVFDVKPSFGLLGTECFFSCSKYLLSDSLNSNSSKSSTDDAKDSLIEIKDKTTLSDTVKNDTTLKFILKKMAEETHSYLSMRKAAWACHTRTVLSPPWWHDEEYSNFKSKTTTSNLKIWVTAG